MRTTQEVDMVSHRRGVARRVIFVLVCIAAVAVVLASVSEAGSARRSAVRLVAQPSASIAKDLGRYAEMKRRLASPAARARRHHSRSEFRRLSSKPALRLAER